jgi:hypothetical protein
VPFVSLAACPLSVAFATKVQCSGLNDSAAIECQSSYYVDNGLCSGTCLALIPLNVVPLGQVKKKVTLLYMYAFVLLRCRPTTWLLSSTYEDLI